jgi:hypothetical protein
MWREDALWEDVKKIIARVADIGEFLFAAISRNPKK